MAAPLHAGGQSSPAEIASLKKRAAQGVASAQYNLGYAYAYGEGVPENYVQAYKWWNLAAASGDTSARNGKIIISKKMTNEQIAEAQRLSTLFKPTKR